MLLKRGFGVRSSWSRSGLFNGLSRPGVARELPFKSHFKGEAKNQPTKKSRGKSAAALIAWQTRAGMPMGHPLLQLVQIS